MRNILATLCFLVLALPLQAGTQTSLERFTDFLSTVNDAVISVAPNRTVVIKGDMNELTTAAEQITELMGTSGPIRITVDSPGGFVYVAREIIEAIAKAEANGNQVTCLATGDVMSAAWIVFNACPRRQSYSYAKFLWHSVAAPMEGYYNILMLRKRLSYLEALQAEFNMYLSRELQIPDTTFTRLWTSEITVTGSELSIMSPKYLTIVKDR